ncbi:MAG: hypothetical protein KGL38_12705, partial [Gemmatimonadota bacterium]|nr:hypothetical protein [Gemmatimonadota bacterium]
MLTPRAAAALLSAVDSAPALGSLLAALGIDGVRRPLGDERSGRLGVADSFPDAEIAAGPGSLRALVAIARSGPPLRDRLARLAARLQSRAPHVLWLVAAADARDGTVALAAWPSGRTPPRIRTLFVDRARIADSDVETICALAAAAGPDDLLLHLRWTEILGRDALNRRFYRELESRVSALAASAPRRVPDHERRTLALLHTSRLLFLAFLETKGWLDARHQFLSGLFDERMAHGGGFHARTLRPLFFGTLNT